MDKQLEKNHGTLILYVTATKLYAQRWNDLRVPTVKKWLVKLTKHAKKVKLTYLIREKANPHSLMTGSSFWSFT